MEKDEEPRLLAVAAAAQALQHALNKYGKPLSVHVSMNIRAQLGFENVTVFQVEIVREVRERIHP